MSVPISEGFSESIMVCFLTHRQGAAWNAIKYKNSVKHLYQYSVTHHDPCIYRVSSVFSVWFAISNNEGLFVSVLR